MEEQVGKLHPLLLERDRPLWKFHVVEGLPPTAQGLKQVGIYSKLHHAAVDGQAAVALANVLLDVTPQPREIEVRPSKRVRTFKLNMAEALRGALAREAQQVARIVRELPGTVGTLAGAAKLVVQRTSLGSGSPGPGNVTLAPATVFNVSVSDTRAFAAVSVPLSELKWLARAHGATLNDMVLMLCSTALRRHLGKKHLLPRKSLVAAVPISLRESGDTRSDNQASMSLINLGTHIADPRKRLQHIIAASQAMKAVMGSVRSILPTDFPSIGVPWLMEAAANLYGKAKVAERIPQVANLVISNVPGPQVPLYMAGARMLTNFPTSIVVHGMALNITVQSFDRSMDFGLMADAQALPDVKELAAALSVALDDVRALPLPDEIADEADDGAVERVSRAARSISGRVGGMVGDAVNQAVKGVVKGAVGGAVADAVNQALSRGRGTSAGRVAQAAGAVGDVVGKALKTATAAAPAKRARVAAGTRKPGASEAKAASRKR
jgi:WS/DGAT/MGAT family acyltransferase